MNAMVLAMLILGSPDAGRAALEPPSWDAPLRDRTLAVDVLRGTFSIVAADPATGEVGVAVQSKYFAVGTVVPWAKAGVGAVATQAAGVAAYGPQALEALASGLSPDKALEKLLAPDPEKETRQLGIVAADGTAASFTGAKCFSWAGAVKGPGFTCQGNILAGEAVVKEMARAYQETKGSLAERLMAALEAGQAAGGDARGQQSAAMIVERLGAGKSTREGIDRTVDLRVDDHVEPIKELRRLVGIQSRWTALREAGGFYQSKDYAKGIDVLVAAAARFPDDATILYDLACFESLAGRKAAALAHLARALELEPDYKAMAARDADLAPLHDAPAWKVMVAPP